MDTNDRSDPNEPCSSPDVRFLHPGWAHESDPGRPAGTSSGHGHRTVMRELASRWRRILLLWMLLSTPVVFGVYRFIEPTFEAVSLLRAEPPVADLYSPGLPTAPKLEAVMPYLQTQMQLIKSDKVLTAALTNPALVRLPEGASSNDSTADLRREMQVTIVGDNTYLIRVALSSRDPVEAAAIVNAVVDSYIEQHGRFQETTNRALKKNLEGERDKLEKQIIAIRDAIGKLAAQGTAPVLMPQADRPVRKGQDDPVDASLLVVTEPQFIEMTSRLLQADFELMDARARLDTAMLPKGQASAEKIRELEAAVEEVERKRASYARYMARIQAQSKSPNAQTLEMSLLTQDLQYLKRNHDVLKSKLAQLEFEIGQAAYRVEVQDKAAVPKMPSNDRRLVSIAAASGALLFLVIGLSLLQISARPSPAPAVAS